MIGDDIKVAVLLERVPKDLRDHLVLESPQLANVESYFPVMREFVQHWCHSRKNFALLRPSVGIAAVSSEKGKARARKARARKARRKGERKEKARVTAGKEKVVGGSNRFVLLWAVLEMVP